jgi:hypothetical protein
MGMIIILFLLPGVTAAQTTVGYTHQRGDGNRLIAGRGRIPDAKTVDVPLGGTPRWVVGAADGHRIFWVAVLEDGGVRSFSATGTAVERSRVKPRKLPHGMPPLLVVENGLSRLVHLPYADTAPHSHPLYFPDSGNTVQLLQGGRLALRNGRRKVLSVDALPDARLVHDGRKRILVLTGPTTSYGHGVMGDLLEADGVTLVTLDGDISSNRVIDLSAGNVIEGLSPIWSDLNGDGVRDMVLTVSDAARGARYEVYDRSGRRIASSPPVGKGFRWRHQIAVAPFGPDGGLELAGVRTPHLGGVVEFFRVEDRRLVQTATIPGFSSHVYGSRNLDMAAAADFDGDGSTELLVPVQTLDILAAVRRNTGGKGAGVVWTLKLGAPMSTNLSAVTRPDGSIAMGVGLESGVLRLWLH